MAFSLRSFFGKGGSTAEAIAPTPTPAEKTLSGAVAADPGFANSMLFKSAGVDTPLGQPVAASPFSLAPGPVASELTVADLLPCLPADLAKDPGLPPAYPVAFPEPVLESALRSGRASIPLYELFRACPSMFLEPVGPHDPREIPLPPHKLAQLIPRSAAGAEPQSPFSMVSPHGSSAPGNTVSVPGDAAFPDISRDEAVTSVFNPSPFGLMPEPAPIHPPAAETHNPFPGSSHPVSVSPFFSPSAAAPPAVESPFMSAPAITASSPFSLAPDSMEGSPAGGGATPFSASSIPGGPVVQSVAGTGSSSEDSSFFSAAYPGQPAAFPPIPAAPAPFAADSQPPAASPPSWGAIFPFQSPAETANRPLPGVGATFFPVEPSSQGNGPTKPAQEAPQAASGFFGAMGAAATSEGTKPGPVFGGSAGPDESLPTTPAASWKPTNPFERIQALAKTAENSAELHAANPPTDTASLFGGSALPPGFQSVPPAPAPNQLPETTAASLADREIKLALAASLKNCAAHDLGTSPENIPSWVQFTLPYDLVAGQLSTGRVVVPLEAIVAGLDAPIRALFAQARSGLEVELPSNAVFHAVSEANPTPAPGPATPPAALLDPFASVPEKTWTEPAPQPSAPPSSFWSDSSPAPAQAEPGFLQSSKIDPIFMPLIAEQEPAPPPAAPPIAQQPVIIPANPLTGAPEFVSPAPVLPQAPPPQGALTAAATLRGDNPTRRLLLTVLLGSPDATDAASFVKLACQLPGVSAVLCVNHGKSIAEAGDGSAEAQRFLRDAPQKISGVCALASLTGIDDAETLHIRSGQVEATFCLQGAVTFAVLHDPARREPALKEKITLLGRELAAILGESTAA